MKRHIRPLLVAAAALTFTAPPAIAKLKVVATTTDLGWFAREVGGERVDVDVITRGFEDPHFIEPKPSYIVKLARADLLLHVGRELEVGWLPKLLDGSHNPDIQEGQNGLFSPAALASVLEKPSSADRSAGDVHPLGNPHYWLSPTNAAVIARALGARLALLDSDGAAEYRRRGEELARRIEERDAAWKVRLEAARGLKVVTYHTTFSYLFDHFAIDAVDYVEPKPGVPPSSRHLAKLIERIKRERVKLILVENFYDPRNGQFVAERSGAPLAVVPVSVGGEKGVESWFDLMELLVGKLEAASGSR